MSKKCPACGRKQLMTAASPLRQPMIMYRSDGTDMTESDAKHFHGVLKTDDKGIKYVEVPGMTAEEETEFFRRWKEAQDHGYKWISEYEDDKKKGLVK